MSNPARILVYGRDHSLLETRCMVLESTGGAVDATTKIEEAKQILCEKCPDLLVLCYTLSKQDRASILVEAERSCRGIKTLVLKADGKPENGEGDLDIFAGARAFKAKVLEVLGQDPSSAEQPAH